MKAAWCRRRLSLRRCLRHERAFLAPEHFDLEAGGAKSRASTTTSRPTAGISRGPRPDGRPGGRGHAGRASPSTGPDTSATPSDRRPSTSVPLPRSRAPDERRGGRHPHRQRPEREGRRFLLLGRRPEGARLTAKPQEVEGADSQADTATRRAGRPCARRTPPHPRSPAPDPQMPKVVIAAVPVGLRAAGTRSTWSATCRSPRRSTRLMCRPTANVGSFDAATVRPSSPARSGTSGRARSSSSPTATTPKRLNAGGGRTSRVLIRISRRRRSNGPRRSLQVPAGDPHAGSPSTSPTTEWRASRSRGEATRMAHDAGGPGGRDAFLEHRALTGAGTCMATEGACGRGRTLRVRRPAFR